MAPSRSIAVAVFIHGGKLISCDSGGRSATGAASSVVTVGAAVPGAHRRSLPFPFGWRGAEDSVEELVELGAGETARLVAAEFPILERADVDAPFLSRLFLSEDKLFAGCLDALGEGHWLGFLIATRRSRGDVFRVDGMDLFDHGLCCRLPAA